MFIRLDMDSCIIGKSGMKSGEVEKGGVWGRGMGVAGFCGPCVFSEFVLLYCRVLLSRIAEGWGCVQLEQ
jgi:hypothetical protein